MDKIYKEFVCFSFEMLEKVMNLPENVKIVSVKETEWNGVQVRFATTTPLPDVWPDQINVNQDDISKIGDVFLNPMNYKTSLFKTLAGILLTPFTAVATISTAPIQMTPNHPIFGKAGKWVHCNNKFGGRCYVVDCSKVNPKGAEKFINRFKLQLAANKAAKDNEYVNLLNNWA